MTDLEKRILDQIDERGLAPRPYIYFFARRSVFWTLAVLSILLGGISFAVIIYGVLDYYAEKVHVNYMWQPVSKLLRGTGSASSGSREFRSRSPAVVSMARYKPPINIANNRK